MRIIFVMGNFPFRPAGGPRLVYEYANRLAARGHQVTVVHGKRLLNEPPAPSLYHRARRCGRNIRSALLTSGVFGPPHIRWQYIDPRVQMLVVPDLRACHIPDGDAVIATGWYTAEFVAIYPDSKGKKFYVVQPNYGEIREVKERAEATWTSPLHKIAVAKFLLQEGLRLGCKEGEMTYVPNGIDHNRFRLLTPVPRRPERVAMFFSYQPWKGSAEGLEALKSARKVHPDLKVVLFGPTWRRASIPSWIEYRRNVPEKELVEEIYNGSRILLFPSWYEGFGLVPAEAMACGCAVVAADNDGVREFAKHEVNALLSPPKDVEALTKNLLRLLEDDNLRIRLAEAGIETIKQFTWERSTDMLEALLKREVEGAALRPAP